MKRNTVVLGITLFVLAIFGWAGWANYEYRKQAAEKMLANAGHAELIPAAAAGSGSAFGSSPLVGKPAPNFTLEDLHGRKISLASYKGKALLINFWATWCGPCKLETPWLVELRNQYASQGFEVLGIDSEGDDLRPDDKEGRAKDKEAVAEFVKQLHMPYPVLMDGDTLAKPYGGLDSMPTSFYVDRGGTVIAVQTGLSSKDEMEARIKKALGEGR